MSIIDCVLQHGVLASRSDPPSTAHEGDCYRVTGVASGDWAGREDKLAIHSAGSWQFIDPYPGMYVFDREASLLLHFAIDWQSADEPPAPQGGTVIDSEARAAIDELIDALRKIGVFPPASA